MNVLVEFEPIQLQIAFDYSDYSPQLAESLERHAANMEGFTKRYIADMGKELADAKAEIHAEKQTGWGKWVEGRLGITKQWADKIIKQYLESLFPIPVEQPVEPVEEVQEPILKTVSNEEKRKVVEDFFRDYPQLDQLSDNEIAKRCGVGKSLVRTIRKELYPEPEPVVDVVEVVSEPELEIIDEPQIEEQPEPEPEPLPKTEPSEEVKQEREARRQKVQERNEQLKEKGVELPVATYACLVVDPPWQMQKIEREERPNQFEFDYPTMTEEELKAFQLPTTSEDCHLYLWTTQKHLPMALRLAEHWGFKYQCLMTWVKNVGFTPFSFMYSTEHVLFCTKGSLPLLAIGKRLDFSAKVREHSRKPDEFYDIVREVSPGPRIDVFSREKREGFEQYGNEVEKYVY